MKAITILVQAFAAAMATASAISLPKAHERSDIDNPSNTELVPRLDCALHVKYDDDWADGGLRHHTVVFPWTLCGT